MKLLFTYDVELWPKAYHERPEDRAANIAASYYGGEARRWGLLEQLDMLGARGHKAVCFVEALSSLVLGANHLEVICDEIQSRGHEVQLHLHPEWLFHCDKPALRSLAARRMTQLDLDQQSRLMELGLDLLDRAGARQVSAHRAGGCHVNLDTLEAARRNGLTFECSYNAMYLDAGNCQIDLGAAQVGPRLVNGVWLFPISNVRTHGGAYRHMQLCAIGEAEMQAGLKAMAAAGITHATLVSHSFELLSRDRKRVNPVLVNRFRQILDDLGADRAITLVGFNDIDPAAIDPSQWHRQPSSIGVLPTWRRYVEQAACNMYG